MRVIVIPESNGVPPGDDDQDDDGDATAASSGAGAHAHHHHHHHHGGHHADTVMLAIKGDGQVWSVNAFICWVH